MKHLRKFNENLENEKESSKKEKSIELAKECIAKCEECKEACEKEGHKESVDACNECIESCNLYVYSAENESRNFDKIGRLACDIAMDCANVCSDEGEGICVESCMNFAEEVEALLENE